MNLDSNKDGFNDLPAIFLSDNASPYLSPFRGFHSGEESNSDEMLPRAYKGEMSEMQYLDEQNLEAEQKIDPLESEDEMVKIEQGASNQNPQQQIKTSPRKIQKCQGNPIKGIIKFLVENDSFVERDLLRLGKQLYQDSKDLQFIFQTLMPKFTKLRKTKEQMTKFCMRKAFKFISQLKTSSKRKASIKSSKKEENEGVCMNLEMPFKKNSQDKTMNTNFLKKTFSQKDFASGYKIFLKNFKKLMQEDNESKINFLAQIIEKYIEAKELQKVEGIKRLPWTRSILDKTEQLAKKLLQYGEDVEMEVMNSR